ncbi:MAG: FkbM family methyltransferase [Bacteroidetes bacterium]|nr:FkbM family methyltransferase [Bacteroidota bacterium]
MAIIRSLFHPKAAYFLEHCFPQKRAHRNRMIKHYRDFISAGDLVFDVGANLGERSKIFRALNAKVIAIEPTQYCSAYLVKLFRGDSNATVVSKALGEADGIGEISVNEKLPVLSTMSKKWSTESRFSKDYSWEKKEVISIVTLDSLIEQFGIPRFCKIDVEGFEFNVLSGLSQPIQFISFEFLNEFIGDAEKCVDRLNSIGSFVYNYNIGEEMDFALPGWTDSATLFRSIKEMNNPSLWGDIYARSIV